MAEAAVSYFLEKADDLLSKELSLPENINTGINKLKRELAMMRASLKDIDASRKQDNRIQAWIQQLRDMSHKIEVVLDMSAYQNARKNALWYARKSRRGNHSIDTLIREIETILNSVTEMIPKYQLDFTSHPASRSSHHEARVARLYTDEAEILGVEEPREELASWILDVEREYKVMFVVGMGGSGKTALIKLVYEQLKTDFDCHAWLTASKGQELLSTMLNKLCNQRGQSPLISSHTFEDLIGMLNNYLRDKRYLIVLDDLWDKNVWESAKYAFPKYNSSRVIISTRRGDIASSCKENFVDIYKIPALPSEKARELFCRRAFPESGEYPSAQRLRSLSENLLKKCEELPLGIIEMGRMLSHIEKTESEFTRVENSLQSELNSDSGQLSSITQLLLLSYNDLPYHLKCCFLYMSTVPEYPVKPQMLIRLWIAEGFINGEDGKILEDTGEEYLKELIQRNLIEASELDVDGRPRTCRVHNLMRMIILSKSEAEGFCSIGGDISVKTRRLSIQNAKLNNMPKAILHHAHTLFSSSKDLSLPPRMISKMKLLKILYLDEANVNALPSGIEKLFLLKYLSLRKTRIRMIPETIGRLQLLETLNLKQTLVTTMPTDLQKLGKLRHLLICSSNTDAVPGFNAPPEISKLDNLQKLSLVRADNKLIQELRKLTQLRKLGIVDLRRYSGPFLCGAIESLENLRSLSMRSRDKNEALDVQGINSPPRCLQRLYLWGHLEKMPHWISKLHDLQRIRLRWSRLADDQNPVTVLGELHNLLELQLLDAYTGSQLDFDAGTFQKLKILEFERMENLKFIMIDQGALPCLQKLIIRQCRRLHIPVGIDNITQLKKLALSGMPPDFVNPLRNLQYNKQWKMECL